MAHAARPVTRDPRPTKGAVLFACVLMESPHEGLFPFTTQRLAWALQSLFCLQDSRDHHPNFTEMLTPPPTPPPVRSKMNNKSDYQRFLEVCDYEVNDKTNLKLKDLRDTIPTSLEKLHENTEMLWHVLDVHKRWLSGQSTPEFKEYVMTRIDWYCKFYLKFLKKLSSEAGNVIAAYSMMTIANLHHFIWDCLEPNNTSSPTPGKAKAHQAIAMEHFTTALKMAKSIPFDNGVYILVVLTRGIHVRKKLALSNGIISMEREVIGIGRTQAEEKNLSPLAIRALQDLENAVETWSAEVPSVRCPSLL